MPPSSAQTKYDAVVIGAGPNGLSAAIELLRAELSVLVIEGSSRAGGGVRTEPLTLPGFAHDACSSVYPLGVASPLFSSLGLDRYGLRWLESPAPLVHVLDDGVAVVLERSIAATAAQLGIDGPAYRDLLEPFVEHFNELIPMLLGPLRSPAKPLLFFRFGLAALQSMAGLSARRFRADAAPALLGGMAAHSMLRLDSAATAAFALILAAAGHRVGWPLAQGGAGTITDALVQCLHSLGGELALEWPVQSMSELPSARAYVFDVTPRQLLEIARERFSVSYEDLLGRFKYGPGVYKMDWALRQPIPWNDPACGRACTVHLSGGIGTIGRAMAHLHSGDVAQFPFMLVAQPSLFDNTRAPAGTHVAWAYCHVPHGSTLDLSERMEAHLERHAAGFRDIIMARSARNAVAMHRYNPNYVGGDINGGLSNLTQLFFRPGARLDPYATSDPTIFLCSSSTPPGGGVHGMCGYWAARSVLKKVFGRAAELPTP